MNNALLPGTTNPVQKQTLTKTLTHFHVLFCFSVRTLHHGVKSYPVYCSGFFAKHQIHLNFNDCYMLALPLAKPNYVYFHCYSILQIFTVILNIWHFLSEIKLFPLTQASTNITVILTINVNTSVIACV
jgi:hypothetical protein